MTSQEVNNQEFKQEEEVVNEVNETTEEQTTQDNMSEPEAQESAEGDTLAESVDWKDKFLRLQAEFDNYRKRTLKEKMDLVQSGGSDVLKAILPIVDDIDRAHAATQKSDDIEALRAGVDLISIKFKEILKQRGVVQIEAIGCELDVDHHEAVARFAAGDENKGKIIDVVEQGYMLSDKVLRFAKVVVGE